MFVRSFLTVGEIPFGKWLEDRLRKTELHAWLEVYLPGAGWIGMDPSLGLLTDHHYIPLATHPEPRKTLPVQGTFGGNAKASLKTQVDLELQKN